MRYQDVFVPGGYPQHTYNPRNQLQLEQRLAEAKEHLCKLVTVTGQTKSGKTVLTKRIYPSDRAVWVDGGAVLSEEDFWQVIMARLDLFQSTLVQRTRSTELNIGAKGSAQLHLFLVKGTGEANTGLSKNLGTATHRSRTLSPRITALLGLKEKLIPLIIDDFHYIPKGIQGTIVRALKPLIADGLAVVIVAIPHRRYDALKVEREMTGRVSQIPINAWSNEELRFIPETGFKLLNLEISGQTCEKLASEAIGSPHLMQDFCRTICKIFEVQKAPSRRELVISEDRLTEVFHEVAETIGRPIFEKLARGPRQRSDRVQRELHDGEVVDIYELVLYALASIRPGLVSLEYEHLRSAIKEVSRSGSQIPQLHEVVRVLKHMATIAATDQSSTPVIDFEEEEKKLHITDPFFAFYLRWGQLASVP